MTIKNKIILISLCAIAILGIFVFRNIDKLDKNDDDLVSIQKENLGKEDGKEELKEEAGITRAVAAKMVGLLMNSHEEIEKRVRQIPYTDTNEEKWYDKYINNLYSLGIDWNTGEANVFGAQENVTYSQCKVMLQVIRGEEYIKNLQNNLSFPIMEKNDNDFIQLEEWLEIYRLLMTDQGGEGNGVISEKDIYILDIIETEDEVPLWKTITDKGEYFFDGFALDGLKDTAIRAFIKGEDIVYVNGVVDGEVVLSNAWILNGGGKEIHAFLNGVSKTFTVKNELSEAIEKVVGDLTVSGREITKVSIKPERINDKVLLTGEGNIELENYGTLPLDENYKIYKIHEDVASEVLNGILVGYQTTDFVVAEGKIQAALITAEPAANVIRVAIKTDGFKDHFHDHVKITADTAFTIQYGKKNKEYEAGKTITIKPNDEFMEDGRVRIQPKDAGGKVGVLSVNRNGNAPYYRGSVEIKQMDAGLLVVNECSLEEYLYAVIPSEMPTSYGLEALKVQAVCARSYAYMQVVSNGLMHLGAHVDDSVSYQVYNNTPESELSIQAVEETKGKVLQYENEVATAYFFSTSCGHTAGAEEVWLSNKKVPYLTGNLQVEEGAEVSFDADLSNEDNFKNFIMNNPCKTFDEEFAWYRWNTTIPNGHLKHSIEASLKARYQVNPALIQTKMEDGTFQSIPVESIGELLDIQIEERKTGGIVTSILLEGSEKSIRVRSEYNIRLLLAPLKDVINRKDGSKVNGFGMMPSAFFFIDKGEGSFTFTGGGYGHGVGMSQNGVKALVEAGKGYEEILRYYYKGVEVGILY